jgi:transcriptional regulator with XRE-family HTH domain
MVTMGTKIRQAREDSGLSRFDLARLIGSTTKAIEHWERDKRRPLFENVVRVAEHTGKPLDYFAEEVHGDTAADKAVHR